ncbi:sugar phosphate isomerase/epimerase family protein [Lysinibacillus sp. FSL H8-0500]|uniref:D-psicose 3-epimerase n=1 Tax=Lysinibacillus sp. FSL H8-0500 TaxID=2921393 RepID=UPI003100BC95
MKYGVYYAYWENEWATSFEKYIQKVKKLGFDVLEVAALGLVNLSNEQLKHLNYLAKEQQISLTAGIGIPQEYDISSPNKETREKGLQFMKNILNKLEIAGIDRIGGTVYSYWPVDYSQPFDKEEVRKYSIASVKELADYAKQKGITLLIETLNRFEQFLINDVEEALVFVREVDKENVQIMLDTFHMNIEEDSIPDAIRKAGEHLGHLHIGEGNRKVPGQGNLNWQEIGDALKDIHYDGFIVMEPFVKMGGQVGKDIKVWRDLSKNASEAQLDQEIKQSLTFVKSMFTR